MEDEQKNSDTKTKVEAPKKVAPKKSDTVSAAVQRGVDEWVGQYLRRSAFSRDTAAWNVLQDALPSLAPMIAKEIE